MVRIYSNEIEEKIEKGIFQLSQEEIEYHGKRYLKVIEKSERMFNITGLPERYEDKCFSNFKTNEQYRFTVDILKRIEWKRGGVLLLGKTGAGKTHLAISIAKRLQSKKIYTYFVESDRWAVDYVAPPQIKFINFSELISLISDSGILRKSKAEIIENALSYDLVILDDINFVALSPTHLEWTFLILNRAYESKRKIILTSNNTMMQINSKESRVASRLLEMCEIFELDWDDYRLNN